jgi:uncharacterized membrane protein YgcG
MKIALCVGVFFAPAAAAFAQPTVPGSSCTVLPANHIFNTRIDSLEASATPITAYMSGGTSLHMDMGADLNLSQDYTDTGYYGIPANIVDSTQVTPVAFGFSSDMSWPDESNCPIRNGASGFTWRDMQTQCTDGSGVALPNTVLPIPAGVLVEGGYRTTAVITNPDPTCQNCYNDAHMLLVDTATCFLWEAYFTSRDLGSAPVWNFAGVAMWDLASAALRPANWSSADAAGFPIYPLLVKYEEAHAGLIAHALRFTATQNGNDVWPATHHAGSGGKVPDGALIRLKQSFTIPNGASTELTAIYTAMKQYGMYMADGGSNLYVQGEPSADWPDDTLGDPGPTAADFEVVDTSAITGASDFDPTSAAVPASFGGSTSGGTSSGGSTGASGGGGSSGSTGSTTSGTSTTGGAATGGTTSGQAPPPASNSVKGSCSQMPPLLWSLLVVLPWLRGYRRRR